MLEYLLIDVIRNSNNMILIILVYIIVLNKDLIVQYIEKYIINKNIFTYNKYTTIEINGYEMISNDIIKFDYP